MWPRGSWILDSAPRIPDRIPGTGFRFFVSGTWIPIVIGIPDSLSCIPDSNAKISRIPESEIPYMGEKQVDK